jgi:hypothetical protein
VIPNNWKGKIKVIEDEKHNNPETIIILGSKNLHIKISSRRIFLSKLYKFGLFIINKTIGIRSITIIAGTAIRPACENISNGT